MNKAIEKATKKIVLDVLERKITEEESIYQAYQQGANDKAKEIGEKLLCCLDNLHSENNQYTYKDFVNEIIIIQGELNTITTERGKE